MTSPFPRICTVGAGALSTNRIYPYIGVAGAQLVGVCDLNQTKAERNATLFGGTAYDDVAKMLTAEKPDGVIVCIGPSQHARIAKQVMEAGIPVYTEKPPAPSATDALTVAMVSKKTGVLCMTAFKKRYSVAYDTAKKWLSKFHEDQHLSISVDYCSAHYANDPANERSIFLLDFGIHIIDLVSYLMGDVAEVCAYTRDGHAYAVSLRFVTGAVGTLNLTDGRSFKIPTEEVELTVAGGNFMTIHNSSSWRATEDGTACEWREPPTFVSSGDSGYETGHLAEIQEFLAAVQGGTTPRSVIAESYKSMVLYEAIRDSSASGRPVPARYEEV